MGLLCSMNGTVLYSRLELHRLTRVPDDALHFWMRRGLLSSATADAGERKHRRFDKDQVRIACFLRAARDAGMNIAALSNLSAIVQQAAKTFRDVAPPRFQFEILEAAKFGPGGWEPLESMSADDVTAVRAAADRLPPELVASYRLGLSFGSASGKPDPWCVYREPVTRTWRIEPIDRPPDILGVEFSIMFAMNQIFEIDWALVLK